MPTRPKYEIPHRWRGLAVASVMVVSAIASPALADGQAGQVEVYKSPWCGCCAAWVDHLEQNGYTAIVHDVENLSTIKQMAGVPQDQQSCHTAMIDGYVIEGHVPASAIGRLLAERPEIHGLTVPGMPQGSPGMEGPNPVPFTVYSIGSDTESEVFMEFDAN